MSQLARDFMALLLAEVAKYEISSTPELSQCRAMDMDAGSAAFFSLSKQDSKKELH